MARFDCAIWRPISTNIGGRMSNNWGLILHHAVANGSLWNFFNSPSAQVSAHFWVSKSGQIEQYVDSEVVAWHAKQLNGNYCGVETEGCNVSPYAEPMTDAMVSALGRLYAEGARRHGWANALANADGQRGFGYHRMAVNTACPCDVRLSRRQDILNRAFGAPIPPEPTPEPPKKEEDAMLLNSVFRFNGWLHAFYVTKSHGQLWHKFSGDNGVKWLSECLMGAGSNPNPVYVQTGAKLLEVSSNAVVDNDMVCLTVYDEQNNIWICRQLRGESTWDRRKL